MSHLGTTWLVTWQTSSTFLSFSHLHSICLYRRYWRIPNFSGFRIFRRFSELGEYSYSLPFRFMFSYTLFYISFIAFLLCVADPSWSLTSEFLLWLPCYDFILVSYMLPFNTCISLGNCVIAWLLDMPLFGKTFMLYQDLSWLLSPLILFGSLAIHHHSIMLSLYTKHDTLDIV